MIIIEEKNNSVKSRAETFLAATLAAVLGGAGRQAGGLGIAIPIGRRDVVAAKNLTGWKAETTWATKVTMGKARAAADVATIARAEAKRERQRVGREQSREFSRWLQENRRREWLFEHRRMGRAGKARPVGCEQAIQAQEAAFAEKVKNAPPFYGNSF